MPDYVAKMYVRGYVDVFFQADDDEAADAYADTSGADLIDWMDFEPSSVEVEEVERDAN